MFKSLLNVVRPGSETERHIKHHVWSSVLRVLVTFGKQDVVQDHCRGSEEFAFVNSYSSLFVFFVILN